MKKILALLVASVILTSCFGNPEELPGNEVPTNENPTDTINIIEDENEDITDIEEDEERDENYTGSTDDIEDENREPINIDTKTGAEVESTDESILEDEVNDLLDEFIDSLDSYDK